jgi:predicted AAA+ superfamily ATPase
MVDMAYQIREVDALIDAYLLEVSAIVLDGPKGVGKTETAIRRAKTTYRLDLPHDLQIVSASPEFSLSQPAPVLFDEWQRFPSIWDAVKIAADGTKLGPFILTGSAYSSEVVTHSGAGRFLEIRMRPMTLSERGVVEPKISISALMVGQREFAQRKTTFQLSDYADEIIASGFPGIREKSARIRQDLLDSYLSNLVNKDLKEAGHNIRRPDALLAFLTAYAAATSTTASWETIRDAATPGSGQKPSRVMIAPYIETLKMLRILDPLPAWLPTTNHFHSLGQSPKHHLADPALAARLLGLTKSTILSTPSVNRSRFNNGAIVGALFESLAILNIRVLAQVLGYRISHMRTTDSRHEIDIILESEDGKILAIEVKLSPTVSDPDVRHLHWLREKVGENLVDLMILTTGTTAYRRKDGVAVVPLVLIGI